MTALIIEYLTVQLGRRAVLEDLNLEVATGEFLVLLGASGCGKSTLLNAIAGLQEPSSGRILINGADHTWSDPKDRNIGMVFQSYALYPTMTVAGNLEFGLRARGVAALQVRERVRRVAAQLQLEGLLDRKPAELSGGQRQRVAIGRALVREASLYLLDEPLSNLDAGLRASLRRELKLLHERLGATMIHVTHDQIEALTLATRLAVMQEGRIQQLGSPSEVYERPANRFVAGFIGSPSMNFLTGALLRQGDSLQFQSSGVGVDLDGYRFVQAMADPGAAVVLGVRPEHVRLGRAAGSQPSARGTVALVEHLGSHVVVWIECAGTSLAVLNRETIPPQRGDVVEYWIDPAAVSLFDAGTGLRR
jgi:multiple sugar transport system ATP-binding protein